MNLIPARKIAEKILLEIRPFCVRAEIAGSIRRGREHVNDIDLVVLPKPGGLADLQGRFHRACKVRAEGPQNAIYELVNGFQLDVFFAYERHDLLSPMTTNWGTLLLCRTGSKEHNIHLVMHAKRVGLIWKPYAGVFSQDSAECLASATEEEIFKALGLPFIAPELRER